LNSNHHTTPTPNNTNIYSIATQQYQLAPTAAPTQHRRGSCNVTSANSNPYHLLNN
jgi:hypothetical protein